MKPLNIKRVQLLILFIVLALNTSWVQNITRDNAVSLSALQTQTGSTRPGWGECDEIRNEEEAPEIETQLARKFNIVGIERTDLKLASLDWDLNIYTYTCVKGDKREEKTEARIRSIVVPEEDDGNTESCHSCLDGGVVNLNVTVKGVMGAVTDGNLHKLKDLINRNLNQQEKALKRYVENYKKNRKSVELDCTKSWKGDGMGGVKTNEDVQACRMEVLSSEDNFDTKKEQYRYFKKHSYGKLKEAILDGDKETREEAYDQVREFLDHESGAIKKSAQQLRILYRYTKKLNRLDRRYERALRRCQGNEFYAGNTGDFYSDVMAQHSKVCRSRMRRGYTQVLRSLNSKAATRINRVIKPRSRDPLDLRDQGEELFTEFQDRLEVVAQSPGSTSRRTSVMLPDGFRRGDGDLILGARGLVTKFRDPDFSIPSYVNRDVDITGITFGL